MCHYYKAHKLKKGPRKLRAKGFYDFVPIYLCVFLISI